MTFQYQKKPEKNLRADFSRRKGKGVNGFANFEEFKKWYDSKTRKDTLAVDYMPIQVSERKHVRFTDKQDYVKQIILPLSRTTFRKDGGFIPISHSFSKINTKFI